MLPMLNRRRLVAAGAALGLVLCWVLADLLVVTDRERIVRILDGLAEAARTADTRAVMQHLSRDYRAEDMNYDGMQALVHAYFTTYGPTDIRYLQRDDISITGQRAAADVVVLARSDPGRRCCAGGRSEWRLLFRKYGEEWRVVCLEPLYFKRVRLRGWRDLRPYLR